MLRAILSSWTLFFGLFLISAGNGLQLVLLGTGANDAGFSNIATGIVMAGYFAGIFTGSILVPPILANVGHVRVFGAMAAIASSAVLLHAVLIEPVSWTVMRYATGFSFAGMYIVCESWLNEKATNETRGQLLSLYMITNMAGMGLGQMMISLGQTGDSTLFLFASVMVSIAVVPILITAGAAPSFEAPERISFRRLVQVSPLAVTGMGFVGVAIAMIFGMGSFYGRSIGLNNTEVGYFMASITVGTLLLQYPVGRLSDMFDRRLVIFLATVLAAVSVAFGSLFGQQELPSLLISMMVFGGLTFALYSLFIAHANDFLPPSQMVAMSSGLLMVNSAGAVFGSPFAATIVELFGLTSFLPSISLVLFALAGVTIYRMKARDAVPAEAQGAFVAIPDTSVGVAVNLSPEVEWVMDQDEKQSDDPFKDNPYVS